MQATKFWIVEYVDVNAPKIERSELFMRKRDAERAVISRAGFIHFSSVADFAGWGLCDSATKAVPFYNQAS